jgi:hypothetical protein
MTCGPYRSVQLVQYMARISYVYAKACVSEELKPSLGVDLSIIGRHEMVQSIRSRLVDLQGNILKECLSNVDRSLASGPVLNIVAGIDWYWDLTGLVKLWWPVGYGDPALYVLELEILDIVRTNVSILFGAVHSAFSHRAVPSLTFTLKGSDFAGSNSFRIQYSSRINMERAALSTSKSMA